MSIDDTLMWRYYELCTDLTPAAIADLRRLVDGGKLHPKKAKEGLALRIITDFHDEAAAKGALEHFRSLFEKKEIPDDMAEFDLPAGDGTMSLSKLLVAVRLAASNSEGTRLVRQGAVQIDGAKVDPGTREIETGTGREVVLKVGKRRFARVRFD